ncbi:MAG: cysteine desulfurase [Thermaceae bacterium]|nr:cysteine desulfurase [Thermaceae bacterium]
MRLIYLDNHATTPCDPRVLEAMLPYFTEVFGNPSSALHRHGRRAAEALERARGHVGNLIGAEPGEVIFTSGATESNNLAILGAARGDQTGRKRILTTPIEHKAVLEPFRQLEGQGYELVWLPVDSRGRADAETARRLINDDTLLVSVQAANNEIGTIQPVAEIAEVAHRHGAIVHCDATQAVGKIPFDVGGWGVDLASLSAHKLYGPKGVGALYVSRRFRKGSLRPLVLGGGQEAGVRSGTHNMPGIVGLGEACVIAGEALAGEQARVSGMRDALEERLRSVIPNLQINGDLGNRLPGNSSLSFTEVEADALILNLPDLALSMGSACNSGTIEPSYVLTAIGMSRESANSTVRVGWGRFNTTGDIELASTQIIEAYLRLTSL